MFFCRLNSMVPFQGTGLSDIGQNWLQTLSADDNGMLPIFFQVSSYD